MLRVALLSSLVTYAPLAAQEPNDTTHRAGWDWDLSRVLSSRRGFIPVPFAFGDPVVGFGGLTRRPEEFIAFLRRGLE